MTVQVVVLNGTGTSFRVRTYARAAGPGLDPPDGLIVAKTDVVPASHRTTVGQLRGPRTLKGSERERRVSRTRMQVAHLHCGKVASDLVRDGLWLRQLWPAAQWHARA